MVGTMIRSTARSVSARSDRAMMASRTSAICAGVNRSLTIPMPPASMNTSGGTDSTAKKAASPASPVTR